MKVKDVSSTIFLLTEHPKDTRNLDIFVLHLKLNGA